MSQIALQGGQTGTISSQFALLGGQTGTAVPDCPPWRAIWGQPPALGKKEGGKQIWSQGGQSGTLLTKIVPRWRIFSAILNLFFCLIAGKRGCGLRLFHRHFFAGFAGKQAVDLDFFTVILDLFRQTGCGLRLFHSDFRLVQANGAVDLDFFAGFAGKQAVDLDFFTVILDLSRVDLDFFAGFVGRRGGSKFGLREGKLAPFWRRGGGVSNEGLLDLMSVDLVFSGLRADISGKIDLSCVDLVFFWFAGFAGKQAVDLDFFAVSLSVRLVQANGTVDLSLFCSEAVC